MRHSDIVPEDEKKLYSSFLSKTRTSPSPKSVELGSGSTLFLIFSTQKLLCG